jgi:hypothetical protein
VPLAVRAGFVETIGLTWFERLLARVAQTYPHVTIEMHVDLASQLVDRLAWRRLDIVFLPGPVPIPGVVTAPARNWGYPVGSPEVTDAMKWGTGVGGDKGLTATLTGSAEVKGDATVTVKVEAGSELLRAYEGAKTALHLMGQLNTNGPGSLGHSSPDASAPVVGGRSTPGKFRRQRELVDGREIVRVDRQGRRPTRPACRV